MNSELPATAQRDALNADIAMARAELGRTVEAIAAKSQLKTRAKRTTRETLQGVKDRVSAGASEARSQAVAGWRGMRARPSRSWLPVAAVVASVVSIAALKYRSSKKNGGWPW